LLQPQIEIPSSVGVRQLADLIGCSPAALETFLTEQLGDPPGSIEDLVTPEAAELAALEWGHVAILQQGKGVFILYFASVEDLVTPEAAELAALEWGHEAILQLGKGVVMGAWVLMLLFYFLSYPLFSLGTHPVQFMLPVIWCPPGKEAKCWHLARQTVCSKVCACLFKGVWCRIGAPFLTPWVKCSLASALFFVGLGVLLMPNTTAVETQPLSS